jgi:hypothetical protein
MLRVSTRSRCKTKSLRQLHFTLGSSDCALCESAPNFFDRRGICTPANKSTLLHYLITFQGFGLLFLRDRSISRRSLRKISLPHLRNPQPHKATVSVPSPIPWRWTIAVTDRALPRACYTSPRYSALASHLRLALGECCAATWFHRNRPMWNQPARESY